MMKNNYIKMALFLNLLLVLFLTNQAIFKKEKTLEEGQLVLMQLAPVDPRSLMQGDYMILNYALTQESRRRFWFWSVRSHNFDSIPKRGYALIGLEDSLNLIADTISFFEEKPTIKKNQHLIKYFHNGSGRVSIGAESYFFEEGSDTLFEKAKYGGLRIDNNGNSILIGLYDEKLKLIEYN